MREVSFVSISAAADYLGPGAIEINRYQSEITDLVRRRLPFGQKIDQTPATGQPSRYFEQLAIPGGGFSDPRALTQTADAPVRNERVLNLKAVTGQINFGLFDVEVNQQQGQFAYLETKDLMDMVDGIMKTHDIALWQGTDTDLMVSTTLQYYGCSGQIFAGAQASNGNGVSVIPATGSLVDSIKSYVAAMAARTDFDVRPSALYSNPTTLDLIDREAKQFQMTFNLTEILPGVVVPAIPTQMGVLPLVGDPAIKVWPYGSLKIHTMFPVSEDMIQYHYLTDPNPRIFQLGLQGNLAAQYVAVKFGGVVVKGAPYSHGVLTTTR